MEIYKVCRNGAGTVRRQHVPTNCWRLGQGDTGTALLSSNTLDPRVYAFRPTIAASYLKGVVAADQFSDGVVCAVTDSVLQLRNDPTDEAELASEMLFGEKFIVYESQVAWAWGQSQTDGYVGFV